MVEEILKKIQNVKGEYDILCVGELLIDYISTDNKKLKESEVFDKFFGGSPANIVFHMTHLGKKPLLITKIGDDDDGKFLMGILKKHNIISDHVRVDRTKETTKSFIAPSVGTPEFEIIRGADTLLEENEVDFSLINKSKMVHTNAFTLAEEPTRSTVLKILEKAHSLGKVISFDPNYRKDWWNNTSEALMVFKSAYRFVDFTKPSLDDAKALFGSFEPKAYLEMYHKLGANVVVLTMGGKGSLIFDGKRIIMINPEQCKAIDATGAGDMYWSVFLSSLLEGSSVESAGRKASFGATRVVSRKGAILEQDTYNEVQAYMKLF